jgi:hypothetical protein
MQTLYARINTGLLVFIALTGIVLVTMLATRAYGGPIDPAGPPSSTLPQVEPRSPIPPAGWDGTSAITIASPGSYFLTRNISGSSEIGISAQNVTLDLNGFTLSGPGTASGIGIRLTPGIKAGIVIKNGTIRDWFVGIDAREAYRSVLSDLVVTANSNDGIDVGSGGSVKRVNSSANGQIGLNVEQVGDAYGTSIEDSNFSRNVLKGVSLVANNVRFQGNIVHVNGVGGGIYVSTDKGSNEIIGNSIMGNGGYGVEMDSRSGGNLIADNSFVFNTLGPVRDSGAGNHVGTYVGDAALTGGNQYSNVAY